MMLAPAVAMMRLPSLLDEGGSPLGKETFAAVAEKAFAVVEGVGAAQLSLFGSILRFWPDVWAGRTPALLSGAAAESLVEAALKPSGRRVRANYRRLSRKG